MRAVKFYLEPNIFIEDRDPESRHSDRPTWAVTRGGSCLNKFTSQFEYEPLPSARDDQFLSDCRYRDAKSAMIGYELWKAKAR